MYGVEIPYQYADGGRKKAGFKGRAQDCVVRALCNALGFESIYRDIYEELAILNKKSGSSKSARNGLQRRVYKPYYRKFANEVISFKGHIVFAHEVWDQYGPEGGSIIVARWRHVAAMRDGVLLDTGPSLTFEKNGNSYPYLIERVWVFDEV